MPLAGAWCIVWIYFGFVFTWAKGARPRFDTSTDMGLVLVPADAEVDSVIFRLRATDQDADFPLVFEITATITPVVRIDNLPCTLYNKVCQANVILTKRLIPGRLHDFAVRVRDTKGDSNSMQATISVTNATTPRDKIFPHIPSLIMVPEDTKPGKELDYLLVRANSRSGKPVYIELWQPKELFTIRQRQTPTQTRGVITLIGELDFETQSMYTLTMYATDPYTEPGKDTRNIAGLNVVVVVRDVQDVPPIFTLAPPLTRINNTVQPGDIILRVHAEDGDKGVPREIVYGLVSEGNPFTPFFNISETTGEIVLARTLEDLTQITHVGAPVVLTVVAEEIRRSREEPPAQATVVDVGFLLGEQGNSPPYFESDNYITTIDENPEPGTAINFGEQYSTRVRDEDIGKAGVFTLKLENNNGTFEVNPTVAERTADFIITVRENTLIDYELYKSLTFKIVAQEVGPATNLSASVPVTIFLRDINDNPPVFDDESYEVTLSENVTAGTRVVQVHATDKDTGLLGSVRYTNITGPGSDAFTMDLETGLITVTMGSSLDREIAPRFLLSVEARDENGNGNAGVVPLIVNLIDVNDNAPLFEKDTYEFTLNSDLTNFTTAAIIKATDADAEPPNNEVRYELVHGNYENKFYLNEVTGELILRSPITKIRRKKQSAYEHFPKKVGNVHINDPENLRKTKVQTTANISTTVILKQNKSKSELPDSVKGLIKERRKRANEDALYTLTARAYDLGVPHLSSVTQIRVLRGIAMEARIVMFVVPGEHPDSIKTAETLATITGGRVTVLETRPYSQLNQTANGNTMPAGGKKTIVVARVEQTSPGTPLVDVEKIRETLAANGVGIISGAENVTEPPIRPETKPPIDGSHTDNGQSTNINANITSIHSDEVTIYKAENELLFWLLIILAVLMFLAIAALIICCICPGCPFYMAPRKRRVHSSETMVIRTNGRPKRHLHRKPAVVIDSIWNGRKQAWSADPTRRNWQFNRRNVKNCGLSSLPGDVAYISGQPNDIQVNIESLGQRDDSYEHSQRRMDGDRMYMEDMDGQKMRGYDVPDLDSLQRHEIERSPEIPRQTYRQRSDSRYVEPDTTEQPTIREQHFYREGNAEVLRLVTRGQVDETAMSHHHHHHPATLVVDGKDIILKRFIEDQKSRNDLSMQDIEVVRSMESHQRSKDICQQQEIILIPERLDLGHRQHMEEIGPNVQRFVIDHIDYESQKMDKDLVKDSQTRETHKLEQQEAVAASVADRSAKEHVQSTTYSFHDLELARQNALLTRLLLERENRHVAGAVDSTSYLETQSLPGQVAIATQTDRTAATQTDRQVRSRSDNDESDEDSRHRKKMKSKKKYGDGEWKRTRTLWMKSPIEEEGSPCFDKRLSILRKKVREVKEGRKISLEPDVLREISDSLDGNGSSYRGEEEESMQTYQRSTEETSIRYKVLNDGDDESPSSTEMRKDKYDKVFGEKTQEIVSNERKMDATESMSSPEIKSHEKHVRGRTSEKSPKKEMKSKTQRKSESVTKPSFRILEKEITMLTKKLSKLGDKKLQESTGSDSTSQEKSASMSKDSKKESDQKTSRKMDTSGSRGQKQSVGVAPSTSKVEQSGSQRKDAAVTKTRQKLKYQQAQVFSTASSEYDDSFEKPKKQSSGLVQETVKQKQSTGVQGHPKLKRQAQVERREHKKQGHSHDHDIEKRRDEVSRETSKLETKLEKAGKHVPRAAKLTVVPRRDHVSEEVSTSTSSDRIESRKDISQRDSQKKSHSEFSGNGSNGSDREKRKPIGERITQRFSDDFVVETKEEAEQQMTTVLEGKSGKDSGSDGKQKFISKKADSIKRVFEKVEKEEQIAEKKIDEHITTLEDVTKQSISHGKVEVERAEGKLSDFQSTMEQSNTIKSQTNKGKGILNASEKAIAQVIEHAIKSSVEKSGLVKHSEENIDKIEDEIKKHKESQLLNDTKNNVEQKTEETLEGNVKEDFISIDTAKEMKDKMMEKFQEVVNLDRLLDDTESRTDEIKTEAESKSEISETKSVIEKEKTEDVLIDSKTDLIEESKQLSEHEEMEEQKSDKDVTKETSTAQLMEHKVEDKLAASEDKEKDIKSSTQVDDSHDVETGKQIIFLEIIKSADYSTDTTKNDFLENPEVIDESTSKKQDDSPEIAKIENQHDNVSKKASPEISDSEQITEKEDVTPETLEIKTVPEKENVSPEIIKTDDIGGSETESKMHETETFPANANESEYQGIKKADTEVGTEDTEIKEQHGGEKKTTMLENSPSEDHQASETHIPVELLKIHDVSETEHTLDVSEDEDHQTTEKENVSVEVSTDIETQKLENGKEGATNISSEILTEMVADSNVEVLKEESPVPLVDKENGKDKSKIEEILQAEYDPHIAIVADEKLNIEEEVEKMEEENKDPNTLTDDKASITVQETPEKDLKRDEMLAPVNDNTSTPEEKKFGETKQPYIIVSSEFEESLEKESGEQESHPQDLADETPSSVKTPDKPEDFRIPEDKTTTTLKKLNGGTEVGELSNDKTIAPKLMRTESSENKEDPQKFTSKTNDNDLPSETTVEEKSTLNLPISTISVDVNKPLESDDQIKVESKQPEEQAAEQLADKQTSAENQDERQTIPEMQLPPEEETPNIFPDESGERYTVVEEMDEALNLERNMLKNEDEGTGAVGEGYIDVSLPLFTSIIDTVDDSDESDSSSDISRKTTLTTRPYHTPRQGSRMSPDNESTGTVGQIETKDMDTDEEVTLTGELLDDKDGEHLGDSETFKEPESISDPVPITTVIESVEQKDDPELSEKRETLSDTVIPIMVRKAADSVEKKGKQKLRSSKSSKSDPEPSISTRQLKRMAYDSKPWGQRRMSSTKDESTSTADGAKSEPVRTNVSTMKKSDRTKVSPRKKNKNSIDDTPDEKPARSIDQTHQSRYRSHKVTAANQGKRKDNDPEKQLKSDEDQRRKYSLSKTKSEKDKKSSSSDKSSSPPKTGEIDTSKAQPKYMAWYKKKREEMEKKRADLKSAEDDEQLPRWLRRSMRNQKHKKPDHGTQELTPRTRRKVKPLVNVESEQLKAIVRQGRKLRKAEGGANEDPPVQIFATTPPAPDTKHHLVQHSEYKYEKVPPPFYLHPPPAPHPSPQMSPERFDVERGQEGDLDSGIAVSLQGTRLRHQQLLEKKSVFDIAYSEAAPSQLRADSTTPPS